MTLPVSDPVYLFALLLLLLWVAPLLAKRLRLPPLVVLIGLGALVGSHGLGWLARQEQLILLERIGLLYIMVIAGIQMDLGALKRLGTRALLFGGLTFGIPFAVGLASAPAVAQGVPGAVLVGLLYSPHTLMAYPIVVSLGLIAREVIRVAIGGTIVTTLLTLVGYALLQSVLAGNLGPLLWIKVLVVLPLLVGACLWGLPRLSQRILVPGADISAEFLYILACVFSIASLTHALGVDAIVGAFITGLALSSSVAAESPVMDRLLFVGNTLFIPAFAVSVGVLSDLGILFSTVQNLGITLFLVGGAVLSKFLAAWIMGAWFKVDRSMTLTVFGLTVSRSALVLVIGLFGREAGILGESGFNALVIYIVVTCLLGPLIVDRLGSRVVRETAEPEERMA